MGRNVAEITSVEVSMTKSIPPVYFVDVKGKVSTSGWTQPRLEPRMYIGGVPPDGLLGFDFVAEPPDGIAMMVILPVAASFQIEGGIADSIKGFRVYSANNDIVATLSRENVKIFS